MTDDTPTTTGTPTSLYRLFDDAGQLLYVGIAGNPGRRFEQHRKDKPWWGAVARIELEHHDDRASASGAEQQAIRRELPLHNVVHTPKVTGLVKTIADALDAATDRWLPGATRAVSVGAATVAAEVVTQPQGPAPRRAPTTEPAITWTCDACGKAIAPKAGYLEVSHVDIYQHRDDMAAWEKAHPENEYGIRVLNGADLFDMPEPVRWLKWHSGCDPDPESSSYWIAVERIANAWQVIEWTAHLMGKEWLDSTNWVELLESVAFGPQAKGTPA